MPMKFFPVENYGTIQDFQIACEGGNAQELATFYGPVHNYGIWMLERIPSLDFDISAPPEATWIVVQLPREEEMTAHTQRETDIFGMPVEQFSYGASPLKAVQLAAMLVVAESALNYDKRANTKVALESTLRAVELFLR